RCARPACRARPAPPGRPAPLHGPPLAQLVADDLVHRLALGRAMREELFQIRAGPFGEGAILERRGVDVDVERRAAHAGESGEYADAAVADDIQIAVLAGAPRQGDDLGA